MSVKRLSCDENGQDPLVIDYQNQHGDCCAQYGISVLWCCIGLLITLGSCALYNTEMFASKEAFGESIFIFSDMMIGMGIGALASIILAFICGRKTSYFQEVLYGALASICVYGITYALVHSFEMVAGIATAVICVAYLAAIGFRVLALVIGWFKSNKETGPLERDEWPMYTVLVPLYKEKNVANNIIKSLHALDYPRDKMDVKLLLEADDEETLSAIEAADVPEWIETLVVPDAQPRTKPRACNHGLKDARGEFLVIFDAEDKPAPDQLKKAVITFDQSTNEKLVCIQASLAYHNYKQNLLTKFFAIEYNMWFTRFQPGLVKLGGPLPLGGTSNHFKVTALKEVGGWDPYNVTEDCDLGVRLHAAGYRCSLLDSVTWEEANSRVGNWLRQRSRWLKGYMITHVVWMRHPLRLLFQLGLFGFVRFWMVISSVGILAVLNPLLWLILTVYVVAVTRDMTLGYSIADLLTNRDFAGDRWSWPMLYLDAYEDPRWSIISQILFALSLVLFAANFMFILIAVLYGKRKDQSGLFVPALLSPLYWVLMSIASWKALWQLIVRPHYWEKTVHGLNDDNAEIMTQLAAQGAESSNNDQSEMPTATDDPEADSSSQ